MPPLSPIHTFPRLVPYSWALLFCFFPTTNSALAHHLPTTLTLRAGSTEQIVTSDTLFSWVSLSVRLHFNPAARSEIENRHFCPEETRLLCAGSLSVRTGYSLIGETAHEPREEALQAFVTAFASETDMPPQDARFSVREGSVVAIQESVAGTRLKQQEAVEELKRFILVGTPNQTAVITLASEVLLPKILSSDITRLGLTHLLGEGTTNFAGSPKNRVFNIKRALQEFESILLAPGEEFSFVDRLGPVDGEHGYLPELVIKHNRTEPEFGGGICQVSSTVFRAAIFSGLKITERRNHAYPVQYYKPYGMDATIYIPKPDLRFQNNTAGHILMQPFVEGNRLTFQIFGTPDGRSIEIDGPHITESNPDGSMRTYFTQTVKDTAGTVLINDTFRSAYKSPALFPHPGDEPLKEKPANWSGKQWKEYLRTRPASR